MRYPSVFVNHGGGPLPLLGKQPEVNRHFLEVKNKFLPKDPPKAIVVFSAHYESSPITITSSAKPPMLYDYSGFPPEAYQIQYPAPGSPDLAKRIQELLSKKGIPSQLDDKRGFDHGVFIPLKVMYPEVPLKVSNAHKVLVSSSHNILRLPIILVVVGRHSRGDCIIG